MLQKLILQVFVIITNDNSTQQAIKMVTNTFQMSVAMEKYTLDAFWKLPTTPKAPAMWQNAIVQFIFQTNDSRR